ncbi:MAG: dockerin type I domain-containing protein [Patescibacteria group bacterium]
MLRYFNFALVFLTLFLVWGIRVSEATELRSDNFIVKDPVMSGGGTWSESDNFGLFTSTDLVFTGTSSTASSSQKYGFLPFPVVVTPQLTATLIGTSTASVSWTAAQAYLGWSVTSYRYGVSANDEDGPYTYTNVNLDLAATTTDLTPDTTYYFVVVVADAFGNQIGTSTPVSLTTPDDEDEEDEDDDQGDGTSSSRGRTSTVVFFGYAHPNGIVRILKDGIFAKEISVDRNGTFTVPLSDVSSGSYIFTVYGIDTSGVRSGLLSFPVTLLQGALTSSLRIFIPPTLSFATNTDDTFRVFGETVPNATVAVVVTDGPATLAIQTDVSDNDGRYSVSFPTPELFGEGFAIRSLASVGDARSPFGLAIHLASPTRALKGDFNKDGRVNLVDFSILAYWQGREGVPAAYDLNSDGVINLADFSILTYHWTG